MILSSLPLVLFLSRWSPRQCSAKSKRDDLRVQYRLPEMLEIKNIYKTFHAGTPNEVRALRSVSLRLESGSFLIIIGTNGSGKSTLLNAVAGTFPVDTGMIELAGRNITRWPEHRRARMV